MELLDVLLEPERRAKAAKEQEQLREKNQHRIVTDPALVTFYWGQNLERTALNQIESNDFSDRGQQALGQLSDALAAQARFSEAADLTQSDAQKKDYHAKALALEHVGERQCQCAPEKVYPKPGDAKGHRIESLRDIQRVSDGQRVYRLRSCLHCGAISAFAVH